MGADMMVVSCHDLTQFTEEAIANAIDELDGASLDSLWDLYEYSIWDQDTEEPDIEWIHEATRVWLKAAIDPLFGGGRRDVDRCNGRVMVGGLSWGDSPSWYDEIGAFAELEAVLLPALGHTPDITINAATVESIRQLLAYYANERRTECDDFDANPADTHIHLAWQQLDKAVA